MGTDAGADTSSSSFSGALRVTLVATAIALIGAVYWFVSQGALEETSADGSGQIERGADPADTDERSVDDPSQVERIGAMSSPSDEPSGEGSPAESTASALAAGQAADEDAVAGREVASIEEVTLDIGDGQQTRLRSGSDGTLAIRELSAVDGDIGEVLGGRITLVSVTEPTMLMLDNGERFDPGARMPNGHVIAAIERERIVLERDGIVSVIRLP